MELIRVGSGSVGKYYYLQAKLKACIIREFPMPELANHIPWYCLWALLGSIKLEAAHAHRVMPYRFYSQRFNIFSLNPFRACPLPGLFPIIFIIIYLSSPTKCYVEAYHYIENPPFDFYWCSVGHRLLTKRNLCAVNICMPLTQGQRTTCVFHLACSASETPRSSAMLIWLHLGTYTSSLPGVIWII